MRVYCCQEDRDYEGNPNLFHLIPSNGKEYLEKASTKLILEDEYFDRIAFSISDFHMVWRCEICQNIYTAIICVAKVIIQ